MLTLVFAALINLGRYSHLELNTAVSAFFTTRYRLGTPAPGSLGSLHTTLVATSDFDALYSRALTIREQLARDRINSVVNRTVILGKLPSQKRLKSEKGHLPPQGGHRCVE